MVKLFGRFLIVILILSVGGLVVLRAFAPERLAGLAPRLTPVRYQVEALLAAVAEDREAGALRESTMAQGRRLAVAHPLDPLPYALVQIEGNAQGDRETANRAALTALAFQPRSRAARMHVVNQLLAAGAFDEALAQITLLSRIDRDGQETYHTAILRLVQTPAAWPAIERAVADDPPWKVPVLTVLAQSSIDKGFLQRLFASWPERIDILLDRFIRDGDFDTAYLTFLANLPADAGIEVPYDPGLSGQPGHPPFNWRVNDRYAELADRGGLDVSYFGRGTVTLLEQVFPLAEGDYRLDAGFEGTYDPEAARLRFRLSCVGAGDGGPALAEWAVTPEAVIAGEVSHAFSHDDTRCAYVRLAFTAAPSLFPGTTRLRLTGLALTVREPDET